MKRKALLVCIATLVPMLILAVTLFLLETAQAQSQTEKQRGISFPARWTGEYAYPDANPDLALENLADTGANWIALIVSQYQDNISSTVIYPDDDATLTDTNLIHVITQAHSRGLSVMLKPHVDLAHDPTHWRGQIGEGITETGWFTAWFASYQDFINHYADLAQKYGVDQFCVGTELSALQSRKSNWQAVITGVSGIYTGLLTYAANHGTETKVTWWDAVDYIGVDAYYSLTIKSDPTITELLEAWQPHVLTLAVLASTWNKPIIFTEIGYRSLDGANQRPYDGQITGTVDLQEQVDTYQAAFMSVFTQPWFAGMYWWAWETDPFQGGPCDDGYTPYDKPAENVLRFWYGAPARASQPTLPNNNPPLVIYTDSLNSGWEDCSWNAIVNLSSTNPVYRGTHAISITAQAYGALSLCHSNFDSAPYNWLEFYVRTSTTTQQLRAFVHDENGSERFYRPVDNCRYIDKRPPIEPFTWTRVHIPLSHLDASGRQLQGVSIKNFSSQPASFWVDEIRLVGALWRVYLPVVLKSQ